MGCDIHLFIEYREPKTTGAWNGFGDRFNPGRSYVMFGRMAGVRCPSEKHIEPRGLPSDIGWGVSGTYWLYIDGRNITLEKAQSWVRSGSFFKEFEGNSCWVSDPDSHTHSWLTAEEFFATMDGTLGPKWVAIQAVLQSFLDQGYEARVVFWFDN